MSYCYNSPNLQKKFSRNTESQVEQNKKRPIHETSIDGKLSVVPWKDNLRQEVTDLYNSLKKSKLNHKYHSFQNHQISYEFQRLNLKQLATTKPPSVLRSAIEQTPTKAKKQNHIRTMSTTQSELILKQSPQEKQLNTVREFEDNYDRQLIIHRQQERKYLVSYLMGRMERESKNKQL